ncbi:hypothetical protein Gotur_007234 [Gossypium turneri]
MAGNAGSHGRTYIDRREKILQRRRDKHGGHCILHGCSLARAYRRLCRA